MAPSEALLPPGQSLLLRNGQKARLSSASQSNRGTGMHTIDQYLRLAATAALVFYLSLGVGQEARALSDEVSGKPGSIIRVWPLEGGGPSGAADAP